MFIVLAIFFFICWITTYNSYRKTNEAYKKADAKAKELSQYEQVVDAVAEANRIKADAEAETKKLKDEAQQKLAAAREKLSSAEKEAILRVDHADEEAARIIDSAKAKAEEIAGDAYKALEQVDELRATERAIRNTIKGYGDEWLKPTYSLLDELADDFSHTDAGVKLKEARAHSSRMVTNGTAASCDYAENNRRTTAIHFVVDAFNGKVDSILSKTKRDNYGILEQQVKDAFQMVNTNGAAFRNARINQAYLESRLQELHWAVIVTELKAKAQEEQRQLREKMREEAKAQREFERAQREAEKEEAAIKKAIEKATAQLEKANAEQKEKYEIQLAELRQKLVEAEERSKRALSMAQQTRHGNVYVISNVGSFGENVYKVGMTRRLEPMDRVRELGDASVPFAFDVHAIIESDDAPALEHMLHQELAMMQMNKVNPRKEFFRVKLEDIRALVEKHGLAAKWTMAAEASEYRETLAIEKRMKNDPDAKKRWAEFYDRIGENTEEESETA